MEDYIDSNGKFCLKINEPDEVESETVPLPLLDKDFLEGDNVYNAKLGEVNDAVFMFEINGNGDGFTGANLTMYEMEKSR